MSRWCQVVSPRFDLVLGPGRMLSKPEGAILFLPKQWVDLGVSRGDLKRIPKPPGYRVNKKGEVECF